MDKATFDAKWAEATAAMDAAVMWQDWSAFDAAHEKIDKLVYEHHVLPRYLAYRDKVEADVGEVQ